MANLLLKPGWIAAALVVAGGAALALYAHPRDYRVFLPQRPPTPSMPPIDESPHQGRITGRVVWRGNAPDAPPIQGLIAVAGAKPQWCATPNPALPRLGQTGGVADAVVMLNWPTSKPAKAWPYPPARIAMYTGRIDVMQGNKPERLGFVPVGAEVEIESDGGRYAMLRARGAAFFTLPLPTSSNTAIRRFEQAGFVELTNAAGYPLERAELCVCEHPFHARTDADGRFELTGLPPDGYTLTARLPNWKLDGVEIDPETSKIMRLNFAPPLTVMTTVDVGMGDAKVEMVFP